MPSPFRIRNLDPRRKKKARKHEVFNISDLPRFEWSAGEKFGGLVRSPGEYGGRERVGVHIEEVPPGRWNSTFHWHSGEEEHFWILEGRGMMRIGRRRVPIGPDDYVVFPPNGRVAHALLNTGRRPLRYVVIGTREKNEVCVYPDSGKIAIGPVGKVGRFRATDYWDGELETTPAPAVGAGVAKPRKAGAKGKDRLSGRRAISRRRSRR